MNTIALLATSVLTIATQSCATPPTVSTAQPTDLIRARGIEIVDAKGRPRITMGTDAEHGVTSLQFLDADGEVIWTATEYDEAVGANGDGEPGPAFIIHGEVGNPGSLYSLFVTARGCALNMGGDETEDDGGVGFGHLDGESYVTLSANHAGEDEASTVKVRLALVNGRVVIRDVSGKELASFIAPVYDEEEADTSSARRETLRSGTVGQPEKSKK